MTDLEPFRRDKVRLRQQIHLRLAEVDIDRWNRLKGAGTNDDLARHFLDLGEKEALARIDAKAARAGRRSAFKPKRPPKARCLPTCGFGPIGLIYWHDKKCKAEMVPGDERKPE